MSRRTSMAAIAFLVALPLLATDAQQPVQAGTEAMAAIRGDALKWGPVEVPGFAPGLELAVVAGDPAKPAPYTLRLRFPSDYAFPAHWHPMTENLTVLSGQFLLAMGETRDDAALQTYGPGDYLLLPGRMPHYGRVNGPTVVQLHGMGPFEIKLAGEGMQKK